MKKKLSLYFMLVTPLSLWAQASETSTVEIDLSDVVVIDDSSEGDGPISGGTTVSMPQVVEIPEEVVEGATLDIAEPVIPVVEQMPLGTEVVLEIPGQIGSGATSLMDSAETISVDFPDEDVRTILRNVADLFDLNLVIPDTLQGRTSLKLSSITWRQVFEVVLEPQGFTYVEDRNIIRIKSLEELTAEPVDTQVFIVDYARAQELQGSVSPLVDEAAGGRIKVDIRSNALVITERPSRMNKIQEIIQRLDKATDQVMIESKFIEVTNSDVKNIGVNWASMSGYSASAGPFDRDYTRTRGSEVFQTTEESFTDTFPGTSSESLAFTDSLSRLASTGRTDTAFFSADQFELILSALEAQDDVKLVSNPTVVTLNNTSAKISIGERYPIPNYSFNSQTGERQLDDIQYEDIGINLDVTPQVNSAGFINLEIIPEVSSTERFALVENTEIPIIESRRTETTIMIKDGFTLAIGGLVENSISNRDTSVPILGDLPGIGRLFSSNSDSIEQRNLIIFITAKTLNPDGSTYKDVIDPRVIDRMGIVPSELPGYQLKSDESAALQTLESLRLKGKTLEEQEERDARIAAYELAEKQKILAEEREKMRAQTNQARKNGQGLN